MGIMHITTTKIYLSCDTCYAETHEGSRGTLENAKHHAEMHGWRFEGDKVICMKCIEKASHPNAEKIRAVQAELSTEIYRLEKDRSDAALAKLEAMLAIAKS